MISAYLDKIGGGEYRPAPTEVCNALGGWIGGIVMTGTGAGTDSGKGNKHHKQHSNRSMSTSDKSNHKIEHSNSNKSKNRNNNNNHNNVVDEEDDDNVSRMTGNSDNNLDDDDDQENDFFEFKSDQDVINMLLKKSSDLELEKNKLKLNNNDIQKKVATLLFKIGRESGVGGGNRTTTELTNTDTTNIDISASITTENISEKENLFLDTLQLIQEGQLKLSRQSSEFDNLALDFQTKLDEKEFRANEISESFKEFKKYACNTYDILYII